MILALVAPHTAGDPMSEQRWLNCRLVDVQEQLAQQGKPISKPVISQVLRAHGLKGGHLTQGGAHHAAICYDQECQHRDQN